MSIWAPRHQHHKPKCTSMRHYIILQRVATSWQLHGKRGATAWYDLRDFWMGHPPHRRVFVVAYPSAGPTTLRRRCTQQVGPIRNQLVTIMDRSRRAKLARESISSVLRLQACLGGAAGHTRHFDPSHSAMAEVICASSGWRLENFCVKRNSRARPRAGCKRQRSTGPTSLSTRTSLPKAIATTHLRRSSPLQPSCNLLFATRTVCDLIVLKLGRSFVVLEGGAGQMADPTPTGVASSRGAAGRRGTCLPPAALTWPGLARVRPNHRLA